MKNPLIDTLFSLQCIYDGIETKIILIKEFTTNKNLINNIEYKYYPSVIFSFENLLLIEMKSYYDEIFSFAPKCFLEENFTKAIFKILSSERKKLDALRNNFLAHPFRNKNKEVDIEYIRNLHSSEDHMDFTFRVYDKIKEVHFLITDKYKIEIDLGFKKFLPLDGKDN